MTDKYTYSDFVNDVASEFELKKTTAKDILKYAFSQIAEVVFVDERRLYIPQLGTFYLKKYPPRKVRSSLTNWEERVVPARSKLAFKPSRTNVEYEED